MMFAGHHTTSGTAAWTLIELMRQPRGDGDVVAELDDLYADGSEVSFQALRSIPRLEAALKETLRLHPPLILLLRVAQEEIELGGHTIPPGTMVGATPRVSNRIAEDFPEPDAFDPGRYLDPRQEDLANRWTWIPFGAGRHRCVGNAFAMMQLKAIFSVILRDYEFEMAQPSESYRDDCSKMVIQLEQPCRVRYRESGSDRRLTGSSPTSTCARGTRCARPRRPTCSASTRTPTRSSYCTSTPTSRCATQVAGAVQLLPGDGAVHRGGLMECPDPRARWRSSGSAGWPPTGRPSAGGDWRRWPTTTPRTRRTAGCTPPTSTSWRSAARRSATYALGTEMAGLDGWHYDYAGDGDGRVQRDGRRLLEAAGRDRGRRDRPGVRDPRHRRLVVRRRAQARRTRLKFAWQRDWFDLGSTAHTFLAIAGSGKAPAARCSTGCRSTGTAQPGHYRHADLPSTVWPPPVERGDYVTQEPGGDR